MGNIRKRVLHISENHSLEEKFKKQKFDYEHFNYTTFQKEDKIIEMWGRIFSLCNTYKPNIIILNFKHEDMINEQEMDGLSKFGVVLELK